MEASSFTRSVKPGQSLLNTQQQMSVVATTASLVTSVSTTAGTTTPTITTGTHHSVSSNTSTKIVTCTMNLPSKRFGSIVISMHCKNKTYCNVSLPCQYVFVSCVLQKLYSFYMFQVYVWTIECFHYINISTAKVLFMKLTSFCYLIC